MAQGVTTEEGPELVGLLKKTLILELFKLGVPQGEIGKKLKIQKVTVNAFLKGVKRREVTNVQA